MIDLTPLQTRLDEWGIEHFGAGELTRHRDHDWWDGSRHVLPPHDLLPNIWMTVQFADVFREQWGGPIEVVSGYRAPGYNQGLIHYGHGASPNSEHLKFKALDLRPANGDMERFWAMARGLFAGGSVTLTMGLGLYPHFVHIDVGSSKGTRTWDMR